MWMQMKRFRTIRRRISRRKFLLKMIQKMILRSKSS